MTDETHQPEHAETTAVTAGRSYPGRSLAPPLFAASTYEMESLDAARKAAHTPRVDAFYGRYGNPTVTAFEEAVAALEGAEAAQAFASGMGAVSSVVLALCSAGDHIVAQRQLYSHSAILFQAVCPRFGIEVTLVDATDPEAMAAAVQPGRTRLVFVETPANPLFQLADLEVVGGIVGPFTVCDSTFAGPLVQRPHEHGIDIVLHSATKGLSGHNDATLGVITGERDLIEAVWGYHTVHGAVASPFDALNGLRGIRTLGVRVAHAAATAQRVAEMLADHPAVAAVHYPGHESHPQFDLAKRQMAHGGTMLSFDLAGGIEAGRRFVDACALARLATSVGGPETLIVHPATTTAAALPPEEREAQGIGDGLIRISVGLEHPDDVLADLQHAVTVAGS
ncbi:MAG: PLP-dependent transferase [Acidobacteria bacterium]|nr:PLP-dependent transferase [Acidobacteriota bacterium]